MRWKDWAGYYAVCSYDNYHEREYFAFRHAAGLMDVTPLFKYEIHGPDAAAFLSRVMVKDIAKLNVGQVTYCCWCDDDGKVVDDGTVWRLDETHFRATAAEPNLAWFTRHARGYDVAIEDRTATVATLSLQGPNAREILKQAADADLDNLGFFRLTKSRIDGRVSSPTGGRRYAGGAFDATITRTGYTGDLGYEIWVENRYAVPLWDTLVSAGKAYGIEPAGLDALDMCRIEAGFIMNGVDYFSANHCLIESRKASPYETGLGWTVNLDRDPFNGQAALKVEKQRGPKREFVGLEIDWDETEALFARHRLPPEIVARAWRTAVPVYAANGEHVGQALSGTWSPTLKKNLALATVRTPHSRIGNKLRIELTVEYVRHKVTATVCKKPFFNPERKRK